MSMQTIESPLPGVFYCRPDPDAEPYKASGDEIAVGDIVGLVEVMKSFMQVQAESAGTFKVYLVEDGETVDAGDGLCETEVDA